MRNILPAVGLAPARRIGGTSSTQVNPNGAQECRRRSYSGRHGSLAHIQYGSKARERDGCVRQFPSPFRTSITAAISPLSLGVAIDCNGPESGRFNVSVPAIGSAPYGVGRRQKSRASFACMILISQPRRLYFEPFKAVGQRLGGKGDIVRRAP